MRQLRHRSMMGTMSAVLAAGMLAAACGSSASGSSSSSQTTSGSVASVAKLVPERYRNAAQLTVATDASYAPNEFFNSAGKIAGMDVDMIDAIAATMGLHAKVVNASFDSILPGLASGKYEVGISSFTDNATREKTVDFVTYFNAGTAFFVKSNGGPSISGLSGLCGLRVAVEKGTTQEQDASAQSATCTAAGKRAVNVEVFPDQAGANLALVAGRADVAMADSPLADYQVHQSKGTLKLAGPVYGAAPYGIALPKGSGLAQAMLAAVQHLISTGQYRTILARWGVESGAITTPAINAAAS